jgi:hypothetical protein
MDDETAARRPLNELVLDVRPGGPGQEAVVDPIVDGRSLLERVREVELPLAVAEGRPSLAGDYAPIPLLDVLRDLAAWTGTGPSWFTREKAMLLQCTCGEAGCWPLLARVEVGSDVVRWSDFEQPHRREERPWRHDGLGPFTFDRGAYDRAIGRLVGLVRRVPRPSP